MMKSRLAVNRVICLLIVGLMSCSVGKFAKAQSGQPEPTPNVEATPTPTPTPSPTPTPPITDGNTRRPVEVRRNGTDSRNNIRYSGPSQWGHITTYKLVIVDNEGNAYGLGKAQEWFSGRSHNPLYSQYFSGRPYGTAANNNIGSTWPQGAYFTDTNQAVGPVNTGATTFWYAFDQTWNVVDTPTGNYTLNAHRVQHYEMEARRFGG